MRNNKAILDEAARSIRRTFIGSVAGSVGMMVVVGAAGAYGMPEHLTARALTAAVVKFNRTFPHAAELARRDDSAAKVAASNTPATAFQAIYQVILGQQQGPRAGYFLSKLEKEFVLKRVTEAVK